jgi:hypothetical protein
MKDKLENFINRNREEFDYYLPSSKVWKETRKRSSSRKLYFTVFSRVAAVLLIFAGSYLFHDLIDSRRSGKLLNQDFQNIYEQIPELKEAENYYTNMVSMKLNEIKPFFILNPEVKNLVQTDLTELDSMYNELKTDLKDNVSNDQVIEAMIQNYRLKLQLLEDLLQDLKQEKTNENEELNNII